MINFEILINDLFSVVTSDKTLNPIDNKRVFSLVNTFENGYWDYHKFQKFIWNNIKETALSYRERQSLALEGEDSILTEAAINLRLSESENDIGRGSEISEILLYGIMKNYYNALPIVPKIFYKQNSQDNAKGADSVHIVIESEDEFSLWFGESKFYKSIENARLDVIIDSVKDSLTLRKIKKENRLITNLSDINDFAEISKELRTKIIESLSQEQSIDSIKPILNIPILLLHECSITGSATHFTDEYKAQIIDFHKERATEYFRRQISKCNDVDLYSEIKFHIILFPVPEKKPIVDKFIAKAQIYRS
ncbi:DUF1837 domain-containing protein [Flavobacterium sp. MC2016-06]|jgi:hypothetical protein|uniref:HamA C-terminal domain-containing protein n=1 Tax=Flavobacterium sp. MC2016-06 TaxID=2676308 RepID=UPI0012BA84DE|nr:DUF1837 domain-containing protein [Flavobacterium sp. MC2016-06]MBU3860492.1 DUF1837 domain-containing protein [Flavobacterium sp. MC2016-06]